MISRGYESLLAAWLMNPGPRESGKSEGLREPSESGWAATGWFTRFMTMKI